MASVPFRLIVAAVGLAAGLSARPAAADVVVTSYEETAADFNVVVNGTGAGTAAAYSNASTTTVPGTITAHTFAIANVAGNPTSAGVLGYAYAEGSFEDTLTVIGGTTPVHFTGVFQISGLSNCLTSAGDRCLDTVANPDGSTYSSTAAVENLLAAQLGIGDITTGTLLAESAFTTFENAGDVLISLPLSFYAMPGDQLDLFAGFRQASFVSWEYPASLLTAGLASLDLVANLYLNTPPGTSFIADSGATYTPEPATLFVLVSGLLGLGLIRLRRAEGRS